MSPAGDAPAVGRLAIVTNIAAPYRLATWDAIARRTGSSHVLLCAESEADRIWQTDGLERRAFEAEVLPGRSLFLRRRGATLHWNPSLWRRLGQLRPSHLIVTGYDSPTHVAALCWARAHRVPCAMWTGSHRQSHDLDGRIVRGLRRALLALPQAFLAYGSAAAETLEQQGIDTARISVGANCIDVDDFAARVDRHAGERGGDERTRFLYVGQLIPRKGVRPLIEAFAALPPERAELSIVGYGDQEAELRARVEELGLGHVRFEGATRTVEETARFYARADVLVMPSTSEVWGLVLNEGLAAGLFCVASAGAGATRDLVERAPLRCGIAYDAADPHALRDALGRALDLRNEVDRDAIADWGRSITPERYADAALRALELAAARRESR